MPFSTRTSDVGVIAGSGHGLQRLIVRVQPVAPDDVGHLHRHDNADQILCVLRGEVLIEVDGDARVCVPGEMGVIPAGTPHGFLGLGAPAPLEVVGEIEVHRPGVPWDRPGPATDMSALGPRLLAPRRRPNAS